MTDVIVQVGLIGCGTVGGGVVELLRAEGDSITQKTGVRIEIARVADKNPEQARRAGVPNERIATDAADVINDPKIQVVVELVGGTTIAKDFVLASLKAGKHVVTANKALLAKHGKEIYRTARQHNRCIAFEASCAGGIPLILALRNGLIANTVTAVYGILNGTCNYILSEMFSQGTSYADALAEAQRLGYAELDPTLDVNGTDTAHKLAILASIAFSADVDFSRLHVEGIESLDAQDLAAGKELGYVCKLLGIADRTPAGLSLRVHPAFVKNTHPLASTSGSFNAISLYGSQVGHTLYYGRGAGRKPTASAVVADLVDIAIGNGVRTFEVFRLLNDQSPEPAYASIEKLESRYYVRVMVVDRPGVMARITRVFGENNISLRAVTQHESPAGPDNGVVPVVILTHPACEGRIREALKRIETLDVVKAGPVMIRLVKEHEEYSA